MSVYEVSYYFGRRRQYLGQFKLTDRKYNTIKRVFDLSLCFLLAPFILPVMAIISIIVVFDSPGSPLFVQERIGYNGRRFKLYKFRSMRKNFDDVQHRNFMKLYVTGNVGAGLDQDERVAKYKPIQQKDVTRIGYLLRKTSLDEIPQIFNVIKGDMSLVGPRPNVPWEVEAYKPWHYDRLEALPGITGLAQVMGRSDISFDDIARYDIQYIKNKAIHFDAWIFWQTVGAVLKGYGAG